MTWEEVGHEPNFTRMGSFTKLSIKDLEILIFLLIAQNALLHPSELIPSM